MAEENTAKVSGGKAKDSPMTMKDRVKKSYILHFVIKG